MSGCKYFGTDRVHDRVGDTPITSGFVLKLGWAAGKVFARHGSRRIIIGKGTRISGCMLESVLETGLVAAELSASFTGSMPTPAVTYLTHIFRTEAGIIIPASHGSYYDSRVKLFSTDGTKLPDTVEEAIEAEMEEVITCVDFAELGKTTRIADVTGRYIEFCKDTFPNELSLNEFRIVMDCTNGVTYHVAPSVLRELGANVIAIGCEPGGMNINEEVGVIDVRALQTRVITERADLGIALGGDGNRVITIDHGGNKVSDDQIMYIIARETLRQDQPHGGAVGTLMSNMGLELALRQLGIPFARTGIDSRYALGKMQGRGQRIGAENPGYVILLDKTTTGNGIVADLQVLAAMVRSHMSLHNLCSGIEIFSQLSVNVWYIISGGDPLEHESVKVVMAEAGTAPSNHGRVLLRRSGIEPLIRMTVEGEDEAQVTKFTHRIADAVKAT